MTVLITLTTAGNDTGPFNLYSNADGYITAFETGISRVALVAGYTSTLAPIGTTEVLLQSAGPCNSDLYLNVVGAPTTTSTTSSTSSTSSTTTTTTLPPGDCLTGDTNAIATCSSGDAAQFTIAPGYKALVTPGGYFYSGTGTRYYYAYVYNSTNTAIEYMFTYEQTGSTPGTWTMIGSLNYIPAGTYYLHLNTVNCSLNGSGTFTLQVGNCTSV